MAKSIAQKLASIFKEEIEAKQNLDKAKDQADLAKNGALRKVAKELHGVNHEFTPEEIDEISRAAAEAVSSDERVIKVRKSEMKLLLEQRHNLSEALDALDKLADEAAESDLEPKPKVNVRPMTLKVLREIRKADAAVEKGKQGAMHKDVSDVVADLRKSLFEGDQTPEIDKVEKLIEQLGEFDFLNQRNAETGHMAPDSEFDALLGRLRRRAKDIWSGDESVTHEDLSVSVRRKGGAKTAIAPVEEAPEVDLLNAEIDGLDDLEGGEAPEGTAEDDDYVIPDMD